MQRLMILTFTATVAVSAYADPYEVPVIPPVCKTTTVAQIFHAQPLDPGEKEEPAYGGQEGFQRCGACASSITFSDGTGLVTPYRKSPNLEASRVGDTVTYCLISRYIHCPKGDDRGKHYIVKNHRTGLGFEGSYGSHICGGA